MVQPTFFVHGSDGREYPVDHQTLIQWVREGRVTPDQMVFVSAERRWVLARDIPSLGLSEVRPAAVHPVPQTSGRRFALPIVAGGCLLVIVISVLVAAISAFQEAKAKNGAEVGRARIRSEHEARQKQLIHDASSTATQVRKGLDAVLAAERKGDFLGADAALATVRPAIEPYLSLRSIPPVIATAVGEYNAALSRSAERSKLRQAYDSLTNLSQDASRLIDGSQWMLADSKLDEAMKLAEAIGAGQRGAIDALPPTFPLNETKAELKRMRRRIAPRVKKQKEEEAQEMALNAVCGEKPFCGSWDGECGNIESALKKAAHDPGSIDVENCTDPVLYRNRCWVTTCDVRGKNAFGALILQRKRFSLSKLGVEEIE